MAGRSLRSHLAAAARAAARAEREAAAEQRRRIREQERAAREAARTRTLAQKEARERYTEERVLEVEDLNGDLAESLKTLRSILDKAVPISRLSVFASLRMSEDYPPFTISPPIAQPTMPGTRDSFLAAVPPLTWFQSLWPGAEERRQKSLELASQRYHDAVRRYNADVATYNDRVTKLKAQYDVTRADHRARAKAQNADADLFESLFTSGKGQAISTFCTLVLERSEYADCFPKQFRVGFGEDSGEAVVEYQLPPLNVVPTVAEFRYVKSKDRIDEKPRKPSEIRDIYQDVISAIALRTLQEIFHADDSGHVKLVTFNGFVDTVDLATGRDIRPCLLSIRATRDAFAGIDLRRVDKRICLRNLGAHVSAQAAEMLPVKPIVEFNMVDPRFVEQSDVIAELDSRPNLMDLSPFEFENLVGNLFARMGLETKQTRSSRDGGVDVVAYDARPVLGGRVIIQAKRYRHTVGVSAVRDLYGTMMNEGANKGILVSTSGYGSDAFNFAKDKPIELIDGGKLLYLLAENGVEARIIMPQNDSL
jgi:restriction system protein